MVNLNFRPPAACDETPITEIDRSGLAAGHASFRSDPYVWQTFEDTYLDGRGLALVAQRNDQVLGWAGVVTVSDRCVYAGVGEISIYISQTTRGQGVGKALLQELVKRSEESGYWTLTAQIFPENTPSLALHIACGFRTVGRRARIGKMSYGPMKGRWRDTIMLERRSAILGID